MQMNREETNKTIDYYNSNAAQYFSNTVNVDMSECCDRFLKYVVSGGRIIDVGAGSGRDIKYFKDRGYVVEGIDASEEMCRLAAEYSKTKVICERIQDWHPEKKYDGIWANASLLHLSYSEIEKFISRAAGYLNDTGVFFFSMKMEIQTGYDSNGRFFTDFSEKKVQRMVLNSGSFKIAETWSTEDGLGRIGTKWINVIMVRNQHENVTYSEVVEKAKQEMENRGDDYWNTKVPFKPCDVWQKGNQINLWTYWQGYQIKDVDDGVDILLVGQDYGNPWSERNDKTIKSIVDIQKGKDVSYFSGSRTDETLEELFDIFDCKIFSKEPGKRLFFTNYSLGYRTGSETGGMTKRLLLKDKELFDDLVAAIKPKIIICLGKITYEAVSGEKAKGFVSRLREGKPFKSLYHLSLQNGISYEIPVYGVAHCGARGLSNVKSDGVSGKENMKKVWKCIKKEYDGKKHI